MTDKAQIPCPPGISLEFREGWEACQTGRNRQTNPYANKRMGVTGPARRGQWNAGYDQRDLRGRLEKFAGQPITAEVIAEITEVVAAFGVGR